MKTTECRYMLCYDAAKQLHSRAAQSLTFIFISRYYKGNKLMDHNIGMGSPGINFLIYSSKKKTFLTCDFNYSMICF